MRGLPKYVMKGVRGEKLRSLDLRQQLVLGNPLTPAPATTVRDERTIIFCDPDPVLNF